MTPFAGRWFTTFGPMKLVQDGDRAWGFYGPNDQGEIQGTLVGGQLQFLYKEPGETGQGTFDLVRHGKFSGTYLPEGAEQLRPWQGQREFDGVWDTSFGRMRLLQESDHVFGYYEGAGPSTIDGSIQEGKLVFQYKEPTAAGEGVFELSEDGMLFQGQWRPTGSENWGQWLGRRVLAEPGITWLVVLEAHWQRSLADNEYAFGFMLGEVFARLPQVRVRQRFFHDADSLEHWCREILYLPEPAILMIASHGSPQGITVHGEVIDTTRVLQSVRHAENLRLLHFSCCLVMQDGHNVLRSKGTGRAFPISGYTTSVDWGGSAILEFAYLDLILAKGLSPEEAAGILPQIVAFAGDDAPAASPYPGAGFLFYPA